MGIRWDAVVDPAAVDMINGPPPTSNVVIEECTGSVQVHVQLFGALASVCAERSLRLEMPVNATIDNVLAMLGERLGEAFRSNVLDERGAKRRHCRLFVGGYSVEDLPAPLCATTDPTEIDIILLIAPEGG